MEMRHYTGDADHAHMIYLFEKDIRRNIYMEVLNRQYKHMLAMRFDIIYKAYVASTGKLSMPFTEGLVRLCFTNASTDRVTYLHDMCLQLADRVYYMLNTHEENDLKPRELLLRLITFLKKWQGHEGYNNIFLTSISR